MPISGAYEIRTAWAALELPAGTVDRHLSKRQVDLQSLDGRFVTFIMVPREALYALQLPCVTLDTWRYLLTLHMDDEAKGTQH